MDAQVPSPQTTLLILLGASAWPFSPEFQSSEAFANAARRIKAYFLNPQLFGLPTENLLDLFDSDKSADELDVTIGQFIKQRMDALKVSDNPARDLLLYFVGHGGFVGRDSDFYLAIRRTRMDNPRASGLQIMSLADTLTERARHLRRIIILDCCFAAAAFSAFQSGPAQVALEKTVDAFEVRRKAVGFPTKGTALLCSSGHKSPSLLLPDGSSTMFTNAFLDALAQGTTVPRDQLTLRDMKDVVADLLYEIRNAPRPVVLSPDQSEGDVADIPFFPNPWMEKERLRRVEQEKRHQIEKERLRRAEEESIEKSPSTQPQDIPTGLGDEVLADSTNPLLNVSPHQVGVPVIRGKPKLVRQVVSRRTVVIGLAGVVLASTVGGSIALLAHTQGSLVKRPVQSSTQDNSTVYTFYGHSDWVWAAAWSPNADRIASASGDNTAQVWDAFSGQDLDIYSHHTDAVYSVSWSPDGTKIASASADKTVQTWDATYADHFYTYTGHTSWVWTVAWSPNGKRIASAGGDGTVQVWDAKDGLHAYKYTDHMGAVHAVAWSPDGTKIASAGNDGTVQVWNANDGAHIYTFQPFSTSLWAVAWSPDGSRIASAGSSGTVQVWDSTTGSHLFTYSGHADFVYSVAWSPDGKRIASASDDKTVQVWDSVDGRNPHIYTAHTDSVRSVSWSHDGKHLASASWDKTVRVWPAM
jgi:WD40 repeat protein